MFEENIFVENDGIHLEGIISYSEKTKNDSAILLFPPHPKLGGDIKNNVITALSNAFVKNGFFTARFNYRGVGKSEMEDKDISLFDYWDSLDSKNDFTKIIADNNLAAEEIINISSAKSLILVGYSFGTKIAAELSLKQNVSHIVLISPPLSFYDYSKLAQFGGKILFILAENDICLNEDELKLFTKKHSIDAKIELIRGEDHFYRGKEDKIAEISLSFISQ
ncbi:MAG: alpha/beta fold hydrolase [Candidatus Schekmanbacteria bacterium]|nr:MAG: alpha/beta fold hydrolase [Candidatus Schekmanbacteria bacterium]